MAPPTERQTFRETVAAVAEKAKARLPQAVNGRIESAVKLVLVQDVTPQADGSILVGSSTDPLKTYRLEGTSCECQDFTRGQAPDGWCPHRIAAGIPKRVQELLEAPVPVDPDAVPEPFPDNDPEEPAAPVPCSAPLPEAPCSCNVYVMISGHKVQVTLRDSDEQRMLARLRRGWQQYPAAEPTGQASRQGQDLCPIHHVAMQEQAKNGQRWKSHRREDGSWCKGKRV